MVQEHTRIQAHHNILAWYEEHQDEFSPPICNKLMHKDQLTVMFVGGPNTREDFHLDEGSEFFYQIRGKMELPIIEKGERKLITIEEGQVFCLPSRVPHSPQRFEGSLGLVIERKRQVDVELDGLRYYTDFTTCKNVLWERYFYCDDLGIDLVPVVKAYMSSDECRTKIPNKDSIVEKPPLKQDMTTSIPHPFHLRQWIEQHKDEIHNTAKGVKLFGNSHPCHEFDIKIYGNQNDGACTAVVHEARVGMETWLHLLSGECEIVVDKKPTKLKEGDCCILPLNVPFETKMSVNNSVLMVVKQDPKGNK